MPSWTLPTPLLLLLLLLSWSRSVATHARTQDPLLPTGCLPLRLGDSEAEDWSPSFPLSQRLPIAVRSPQRAWRGFSFVFQRRDSTSVATLEVRHVAGNVVLALRGRAYDGAAPGDDPVTRQVKLPKREGPQQLSLQDWAFVDLSVEGGRLEVALQGMAGVRFDQVNATRFHQVYVHVSKGQYIDVSFQCGDEDGRREAGPASSSPSEGLHGRAAAAVAVVIVVVVVLLTPTAVACCCLRRRRKKMMRRKRRERVHEEGAAVASLQSPERASLMAHSDPPLMQGTVAKDAHGSHGSMHNVVAGDKHVSQEVVHDTASEGKHRSQGVVIVATHAKKTPGSHAVMRVMAAGDISGESGGLVTNSLISSHTMETNSPGSEAPERTRKPDEEHAEDTDEDVRNERQGTHTEEGQSTSDTNVRESGNDDKAQEPVGPTEADEAGELGNEARAHEADEPGKDRAQKFLQGLSKTREQVALHPAGPYGREVSSLPVARSNSFDRDGAQGRGEPAGTSGVGRVANTSQERRRLTDVISEMRDIQRGSGTGVMRGNNQTGGTGREMDDGESSGPPAQTGGAGDATHDASRETEKPNKPSYAAEGLEADDSPWETVAPGSEAPRDDSTLDDTTMGKSETDDGGGSTALGEYEDNTRKALSTIVFPVGDSDYGVEKFKESGIEAMYLETPREETYIKTQPKKIYRSTPLTSLKLP
ncbi:uncharacterized protein [Panulirus ornatus]|uniref:uncharacterized protein n=1 Tax=Panulirus ornatus TaxID=150431 RepID=UPI003A8661F2